MAKRAPFAVHNLLDCEPGVAIVRYDGDPDVFTALTWAWLIDRQDECEDGHYSIEAPLPRLYRINPTDDPDFSWTLSRSAKRGRGVFTGAVVTRGRTWQCHYCCASVSAHFADCVTLRRTEPQRVDASS